MTNTGFSQLREWKHLCKYYEQDSDKGKRPWITFAKEIPSVFPLLFLTVLIIPDNHCS